MSWAIAFRSIVCHRILATYMWVVVDLTVVWGISMTTWVLEYSFQTLLATLSHDCVRTRGSRSSNHATLSRVDLEWSLQRVMFPLQLTESRVKQKMIPLATPPRDSEINFHLSWGNGLFTGVKMLKIVLHIQNSQANYGLHAYALYWIIIF